jgi:chromate reductase
MLLQPTKITDGDKIMTDNIHILGISGSLRRKSTNSGLLCEAIELLPKGMTLEIYDLSDIPMYNQDLYAEGEPAAVQDLKSHIANADALLIATPEYNHSIPGMLKNALDWASRPHRRSPLNHKLLGIMGAAGSLGSLNAQEHLRQIAAGMDMQVLEHPQIAVKRAWEKFDSKGRLTDEHTRVQIKEMLEALAVRVRHQRER